MLVELGHTNLENISAVFQPGNLNLRNERHDLYTTGARKSLECEYNFSLRIGRN